MNNIIGNLKNKTLFVVSDIHGCFNALQKGLAESGFNEDDPNNVLVVNGDLFDKGNQNLKVYKYLISRPKNNVIFIRGNHEDLFVGLAKKEQPDSFDFHNGTVRTFYEIAKEKVLYYDAKKWSSVKEKVLKSDVYAFLNSDIWQDYLEIGHYIITHGFIPSKKTSKGMVYDPLWRSADKKSWNEARWENGALWVSTGMCQNEIQTNRVFVVGHLKARYFPQFLKYTPIRETKDDIYYGKNIIGIDGDAYNSNKVNVLKLQVSSLNDVKIIK